MDYLSQYITSGETSFFEGGEKALISSSVNRASKSEQAKVEELEKVIGRQTVVIEVLKKKYKHDITDNQIIDQLNKTGMAITVKCDLLSINRSNYYRNKQEQSDVTQPKSDRTRQNAKYLEIIKEIKTEHHFWGYRRVRAYMKLRISNNPEYIEL